MPNTPIRAAFPFKQNLHSRFCSPPFDILQVIGDENCRFYALESMKLCGKRFLNYGLNTPLSVVRISKISRKSKVYVITICDDLQNICITGKRKYTNQKRCS